MFLTEQEIKDTPQALQKTLQYFKNNKQDLQTFFTKYNRKKFVFFGCGSSYMLAKSAETVFGALPETAASAIPAGDYIVNPEFWAETVRSSIVVMISRSGRTSEMVRAVKHVKDTLDCPVISISMEEGNDLMPMSDLNLTMDWCYDKSVCQTRTVTNLYTALLLLAAEYAHKDTLAQAVAAAIAQSEAFQQENEPLLEQLAQVDWNSVVVLADGPLCGLAEEGALAFTEIAMLTGRYFHLLDYRHGPVVISDPRTLTIMVLQPGEEALQSAMVYDIRKRGGMVVTVSADKENKYGATVHIQIPGVSDFAAWGILVIYVAQMTAFKKALANGGNPDAPQGLDAYITLK